MQTAQRQQCRFLNQSRLLIGVSASFRGQAAYVARSFQLKD
jgi:hypothetical protein